MNLVYVALGGALGSVLRALTIQAGVRLFGPGFPVGTLFVNVAGGFAIGLLAVLLVERGGGRHAPLLMTGVLGGFTTFSAFSLDTLRLIEAGRIGAAAAYVAASVALSIAACALGLIAARGWAA